VALGYAVTVAYSHFKGYDLPYTSVSVNNSTTVIYVDPELNFPFDFNHGNNQQMIILALKMTDNMMILTVLFTHINIYAGNFVLTDITTVPVVTDDDKITAIYTEQDINIGIPSDTIFELNLSQEEMDFELSRLNFERPADEYIAIEQNVWIIDVDYQGTYADFFDDTYTINGGAQKVEISNTANESSSSVYQLAMILTELSPSVCRQNPVGGYALLQVVDMSVNNQNIPEELVLGTALFSFHGECDGKAEITVGTGNYLCSTGKEVNLGL
jgi:hypothetical protein